MDPNATAADIYRLLQEGDPTTACALGSDLASWVGKGGFVPRVSVAVYAAITDVFPELAPCMQVDYGMTV